ncbi:ASKHA domain-containing protein [Sporomusa sp.]|uniref:ASKHA domain-containing protein n=1 Tax=Sporomusa sp. TaxID=2078658 RepID=UPI002C4A4233|nr:ASKHA domain-containing protein [Sporomusa sp.]HWR05407.1 ASKHA domain-containing protein [Sporomusa sp.]
MSGLEQRAITKVIIDYEPVGKRVYAGIGQTILAAAQGLELFEHGISAPCGGKGLCGRCLVRLIAGELSLPSANEMNMLAPARLEQGYRLACQAQIAGPCKIEIPVTSLIGRQQLQVESQYQAAPVDYPFKRYSVSGLINTSIHHPHSLWQQIEKFLKDRHGVTGLTVSLALLRRVNPMVTDGELAVAVCGSQIVNVAAVDCPYTPFGLAIDLGTTKIAAFLIRLDTGETVAAEGILNPQIAYGEDLMSRLAFAMAGEDNARQMVSTAAGGINELAERLALTQGISVNQISQAVIVGNTAMHHLLLGLPIKQLVLSPYVPAATLPIETAAISIGLNLGEAARVYMTPPIGGFVGGDHVAMIQASRIDEAQGITLGIDIGTNTEIVLAVNGRMLSSCSCASGPAFEGAHIYQGMRAVNGAISEVRLSSGGMGVSWQTIGNQKPIGLCGSGIIDLIAELNKAGVIAENGRLNTAHPRVRTEPGKVPEFLVVPCEESGCDCDIVITQKDIGEIQLAKAAIASGIILLSTALGVKVEEIEQVIIAGAFGSFLRLESAIAVGMLPNLPLKRFSQVGNAAGAGACMSLISERERRRAECLATAIEHVELAIQPTFKRVFAKSLQFPRLS